MIKSDVIIFIAAAAAAIIVAYVVAIAGGGAGADVAQSRTKTVQERIVRVADDSLQVTCWAAVNQDDIPKHLSCLPDNQLEVRPKTDTTEVF